MKFFCTYCDEGYAARLLCLHASLRAQGEPFRLLVLCLDEATVRAVASAGDPDLVSIAWPELLEADREYAAARADRTPMEFYFTTTPALVRHCLNRAPKAERMTYLDADLYFFGPPSAVFAEQGEASVGIVPHRFPPQLAERLIYGTYNVAWVSFRRDEAGLACLAWWRERCLAWCHDRVEDGKFADQGYLNEFPRRFTGVRVLDHPGINAAPWNIDGAPARAVATAGGGVTVGGRPLLFYHFQGVREVAPGWFEPGLRAYGTTLTRELRELIYRPYLRRLDAAGRRLAAKQAGGVSHSRVNLSGTWRDRWERAKRRWLLPYYGRLTGRLVNARMGGDTR